MPRRRRLSTRSQLLVAGFLLTALVVFWAIIARATAPTGNTALSRFDAIIVLGSSADSEGNPTSLQLAHVTEAVHEYERGIAPRLILTGGAVRNQYVEAQVMARSAEALGVPASALVLETQARDTIQNACNASRIMQAHGWRSAEVISSAEHLPRAGLIFSHTPIEWRAHAAPPLEPPAFGRDQARAILETLKTIRYLVYARWAESCSP